VPYKVTFIILDDQLQEFLKNVPYEAEGINRFRLSREHSYVDGKRKKSIKGEDLLLKLFIDEPYKVWSIQELSDIFVKHSFVPQSVSSYLSRARINGLTEALGDQNFCLKKGN